MVLAAVIQMDAMPDRVRENRQRAEAMLVEAHCEGARIAVLPELFNTGYSAECDYDALAEPVDGPTVGWLSQRSRQLSMLVVGGWAETDGRDVYNSAVVCQPDGAIDVYRKRHTVFWESSRFRAGRAPLIVATPWGRIGLAICADMIYRRVWQGYRHRIDLAIVASAWPEFVHRDTGRRLRLFGLGRFGPLCREIPRQVARDLGVPVLFANQCGNVTTTVPGWPWAAPDRFAGCSGIVDAQAGRERFAKSHEPDVVVQEIVVPASPTTNAPILRSPTAWVSTSGSASTPPSYVSASA